MASVSAPPLPVVCVPISRDGTVKLLLLLLPAPLLEEEEEGLLLLLLCSAFAAAIWRSWSRTCIL